MFKQLVKPLFIVLFLMIGSHNTAEAQFFKKLFHKKSAAEKGEEAKKQKDREEKEKQAKLLKKAQDYHMSLQSKEVRKRMKKSRRQAARANDPYRQPFYKRWFTRTPHESP